MMTKDEEAQWMINNSEGMHILLQQAHNRGITRGLKWSLWVLLPTIFFMWGCESSPVAPSVVNDNKPSIDKPTNTPSSNNFSREVIRLTNLRRNSPNSCGPGGASLRNNSSLSTAAQKHSEDMNAHNYFSHTGRNGSSPADRARDAGYNSTFIGENIARGQRNPSAVVQAWMNSEGHCRNIMNPNYRDIGVGYSNGYWTMMLGRR